MSEFAFRLLMAELVRLGSVHPGKPCYGHPCSRFMQQSIVWPSVVEDLYLKVLNSHSYEYSLNGAGLKLYSSAFDGKLERIRIGGDQSECDPDFVYAANNHIEEVMSK